MPLEEALGDRLAEPKHRCLSAINLIFLVSLPPIILPFVLEALRYIGRARQAMHLAAVMAPEPAQAQGASVWV